MINALFKRFSGSHYRRFIKRAQPIVAQINQIEEEYQSLSDEQLRAKTDEFRARFQEQLQQRLDNPRYPKDDERHADWLADERHEILTDLLPEAFAAVKNTARRLCGQTISVCDHDLKWEMVHYDVQLIGGMAIHHKHIAEMATGEGKTLVSTLPLYLNALSGLNCQLVTVNDYLARRDAEWMGYIYKFLGLTVGCIQNSMPPHQRREAYGCDITYGTSSEFGFDYLRDNGMATTKADQVQRDHFFCIVDEIDSILIDEARTPLIISGPVQEEREAPFRELKPSVEKLAKKQQAFCNELANDAKKLLDEDIDNPDAMEKLLLVRRGMPKNKPLLRMMEDNNIRKRLDKFDLEMSGDFNKTAMYHLKEQLFYVIDEKQRQADLTEKGRTFLRPDNPDAFVMPDLPTEFMEIDKRHDLSDKDKTKAKQEAEDHFSQVSEEIHCIGKLLSAYALYERDIEYVVKEGKVMIVDENTGRLMPGRRWSEGLHQAVEAKEGVDIEKETKTYASITIQNYFRMYDKLAGMTGTAETEAGEFYDIYKLNVMVIPTHRPCVRKDSNDIIYKTRREKYHAVLEDIQEANHKGQPVLVGTTSVEASEVLGRMLKRSNITHSVLNAKFHEQEAEIVANAGQRGAVTIATNMAGRGTDIKLGEGVSELGGLLVLGTERHESRRIDRQLRGRCARQGDPGESRFYVSLEDNLMRLFANAGPISRILDRTFQEGEILEHPLLNRSIESAQKKVEQQNFSIRKRLLQYDDVLNKQREVVYSYRNDAIHSDTPKEIVDEMIGEELEARLDPLFTSKGTEVDHEALESFVSWMNARFPISLKPEEISEKPIDDILPFLLDRINEAYKAKQNYEEEEALKGLERYVIIRAIDKHWQSHLTEMEDLRRSVGLRGYGQKDPLNEYKSEAYVYFNEMMSSIRGEVCLSLFRSATNFDAFKNMLAQLSRQAQTIGPDNVNQSTGVGDPSQQAQPKQGEAPRKKPGITIKHELPKIGRNEMVTIRKGPETQQMKFKKAEALIRNEGWQLVVKK